MPETEMKDRPVEPARGGNGGNGGNPNGGIRLFGRRIAMPRSRLVRVALGVGLVIGGLLGFLPILGFWMVPAGLLVLSYEFALIRRLRRRTVVWWGGRGRRGR